MLSGESYATYSRSTHGDKHSEQHAGAPQPRECNNSGCKGIAALAHLRKAAGCVTRRVRDDKGVWYTFSGSLSSSQ